MKRYRLQYLHGSLTKSMGRTLEPVGDDDYIKVSELRESLILNRQQLKYNIDTGKILTYPELDRTWGKIDYIDTLLAALDSKEENHE